MEKSVCKTFENFLYCDRHNTKTHTKTHTHTAFIDKDDFLQHSCILVIQLKFISRNKQN